MLNNVVLFLTGTVAGMCIFSVWLRIPDSIFAVCVFVTKFAQTFISGLAPHDWYLYIGKGNFIFFKSKLKSVAYCDKKLLSLTYITDFCPTFRIKALSTTSQSWELRRTTKGVRVFIYIGQER
jgi:hypothetical protein